MNSPSINERVDGTGLNNPIFIDLGKVSRKKAKQLKKGKGLYLTEVQPAVAEVIAQLGAKAAGKETVTVVVLYRKKPSKRKLPMLNLLS